LVPSPEFQGLPDDGSRPRKSRSSPTLPIWRGFWRCANVQRHSQERRAPTHAAQEQQGEFTMFAKINHMAMVSPQWPFLARFYEAVFGLQPSTKVSRPFNACTVGDGYVGLNINPLRDGGIAGIDHFGMVVDDAELVLARMQKKFARSGIVKRPSTRPFAAYSGHDPDGNVFDLAEKNKSKLSTVYAEQAEKTDMGEVIEAPKRIINKFAIRTMNAEAMAEFYHEVFELEPTNKPPNEPGAFNLTDGRVTLSIMPWSIDKFAGIHIKRPGPDHLGFKVESIAKLKEDIAEATGRNTYLAPMPMGGHTESDNRKKFLEKLGGQFHLADPAGNWIVVEE
jgi:predicted enzyme related to lactoylglutathione lyase